MVESVDTSKLIVPARSDYKVKGSGRKDHDRQKGDFYEEIARVQDGPEERKKHSSNRAKRESAKRYSSQGHGKGKSRAEDVAD